mmetsp:Transcript_145602/g.363149  ORF Transcript_145602/g.363149 Transcript_145602/m.363149 type:complete len:268 (-) Transcript_145602:75-878(-)
MGDRDGSFADMQRSAVVGIGMAVDIAINYPLWIAAKRIGAGLPAFPGTVAEVYRGGGSLWLSLGPTTIMEDVAKRSAEFALPQDQPQRELVASAFAGALAGGTFCAQVERVIAAAHARGAPMGQTLASLYREGQARSSSPLGGLSSLLLPPGMAAMMGREVPFVAALFYVRPLVTTALYGDDGGTRQVHLEVAAGLATSALTSPVSHVPSVVAAYQQGHGVGLHRACQDIYGQGGLLAFWRGLGARTLTLAGTMIVVPNVMAVLLPE